MKDLVDVTLNVRRSTLNLAVDFKKPIHIQGRNGSKRIKCLAVMI